MIVDIVLSYLIDSGMARVNVIGNESLYISTLKSKAASNMVIASVMAG